MKTNRINRSRGFTIIETLIVLAIAATIFLVVFLAVSSLDRSSRNTERKDDAAAVLAGIGNYTSNNSGALPPSTYTGDWTAPNLTLGQSTAGDVTENVRLAHYTGSDVYIDTTGSSYTGTPTTPSGSNIAGNDFLIVDENSTCTNSATATPSSPGAYAIIYTIETGSGWSYSCIGS